MAWRVENEVVSHEAAVGADAADQVVPAEAAQLGAVAVASVAAVETAASTTNASAPNAAARAAFGADTSIVFLSLLRLTEDQFILA